MHCTTAHRTARTQNGAALKASLKPLLKELQARFDDPAQADRVLHVQVYIYIRSVFFVCLSVCGGCVSDFVWIWGGMGCACIPGDPIHTPTNAP